MGGGLGLGTFFLSGLQACLAISCAIMKLYKAALSAWLSSYKVEQQQPMQPPAAHSELLQWHGQTHTYLSRSPKRGRLMRSSGLSLSLGASMM